jgi:hypothetical protein
MDLPPIEATGLENITLPDVRRLDRLPSLPAWLQRRIAALENASQSDNRGN